MPCLTLSYSPLIQKIHCLGTGGVNCFTFYFYYVTVLFLSRKEDPDLYESVEHFDEIDQETKSFPFVEKPSNKLAFKYSEF
jgi:hypothetical protein